MNADAAIALAALPMCVVGIAWAAIARRERQIGDEPRCLACGYDLRGRVGALQGNCPECGASLTLPGAIRRGIGGPQPIRLTIAIGLTLLSLLLSAWRGTIWAKQFDWTPYYPTSWLLPAARSPRSDQAAMNELKDRVISGKVRNADLPAIISAALAEQAGSAPWNDAWGEMLERLHQNQRLPEIDWNRYLDGIVTYTLTVRPYVYLGEPPAISVHTSHSSRFCNLALHGKWTVTAISLNGAAMRDVNGGGEFDIQPKNSGSRSGGPSIFKKMKSAGWQHLKVQLDVDESVTCIDTGKTDTPRHITSILEGDSEVGPPLKMSASDVERGRPWMNDKIAATVIRDANGHRALQLMTAGLPFRIATNMSLRILSGRNAGQDVLHRYASDEGLLPWTQFLPLAANDSLNWTTDLPPECPGQFDVVLTPDAQVAARGMDSSAPWPEQIVIAGVTDRLDGHPATTQSK